MSAHKIRFCPNGHDKDAPGGSIYLKARTAANTVYMKRACARCHQDYKNRWGRKNPRKKDLDEGGKQ